MTLVLALANCDCAVMVADRRLVGPDGKPYNDDSDKLTILRTEEARVLYAFSGLAEVPLGGGVGAFQTHMWLARALANIVAAELRFPATIAELAIELGAEFRRNPLISQQDPQARRLHIGFVGFRYDLGAPQPIWGHVTNVADDGTTASSFVSVCGDNNTEIFFALGATATVRESKAGELLELLTQRKPARAILEKAVDICSESHSRQEDGSVGPQYIGAYLPADPALAPVPDYYPDGSSVRFTYPTEVTLYPGQGGTVTAGATLMTSNERLELPDADNLEKVRDFFHRAGNVMGVGQARAGQPCHCGSGIRYRDCHGAGRQP